MSAEDTQFEPGISLDSTLTDEDITNIFTDDSTTKKSTSNGSESDSGHSADISGHSEDNSGEQERENKREEGEEGTEEAATNLSDFVTTPILSSLFSSLDLDFDEEELSAAIIKHGDDMEGIAKVIKDIIDTTVEANSEPQYASEISKQFDYYLRNGGDVNKFFDVTYSSVDYSKLDMSNVNNQAAVLREYYRATTNLSNEKIDKTIKALHTAGELESTAKEAVTDLIQFKEEERLQLLKEQELAAEKQKQQYQEEINKQRNTILNGTKADLGFVLPDTDKKGFVKFLYERDPVTQETAYQTRMKSTPNFGLRLAYLAYKNALTEEGLMKVSTTRNTQKVESTIKESIDKLRARPKNNTTPAAKTSAKGDRAYLEEAIRDLERASGIS